MKTRFIFLLPLVWLLIGCNDSETATLELSESNFNNISASNGTVTIDITCSSSWNVRSNKQWCTPNVDKGEKNGKLILSISANLNTEARTAIVTIISEKITKTIQVTQQGSTNTSEEYHYKLPVIFHVLYSDKNDPLQYVDHKRLAYILQAVNKRYKGSTNSPDMNLTFTLATTDPQNELLTTPGVEYIEWSENYPIDCEAFMNDNSGKYARYLWDPNQYINIMVYNFTFEIASHSITLGITHLPFSNQNSHYLEGVNPTTHSYISKDNLKFPYCVSINSSFIDSESTSKYIETDVIVTLAHELGHYLGLLHVFAERGSNILNECKDTDYCKDTPSYNKTEYDSWLTNLDRSKTYSWEYLCQRHNCEGNSFISTNIMDYIYSYSNEFTLDQRKRIRHVLSYSPLIPGPKKENINTRAIKEGPLDLPIRVIK